MDQLLAVDVLKTLGNVNQDTSELCLREPETAVSEVIDLPLKTSSLAVLVLYVDLGMDNVTTHIKLQTATHRPALHPAVVVPHHVLVLHQSRVSEHLVHCHLLVVAVLPDSLLGDLDSVDHPIKTMSGLLDNTKLSASNFCQF